MDRARRVERRRRGRPSGPRADRAAGSDDSEDGGEGEAETDVMGGGRRPSPRFSEEMPLAVAEKDRTSSSLSVNGFVLVGLIIS